MSNEYLAQLEQIMSKEKQALDEGLSNLVWALQVITLSTQQWSSRTAFMLHEALR